MNTNISQQVIICPVCGCEYLPIEIFVPSSFFGKLNFIRRDENGKIKYFLGEEPDYIEYFKCGNCNNTFKIFANIQYNTQIEDKLNFNMLYETKLEK